MASRTAATEPATVAARLRLTATRLARRLRQQADIGLTPSQLSALAAIDAHGPLTLGTLAEHERVAPPSITKVVTKLEAARLVTRRRQPDDGRVSVVSVTPAGQALIAESRQRKTAWLAERLADFDAAELAKLEAALDVLDRVIGPDE